MFHRLVVETKSGGEQVRFCLAGVEVIISYNCFWFSFNFCINSFQIFSFAFEILYFTKQQNKTTPNSDGFFVGFFFVNRSSCWFIVAF